MGRSPTQPSRFRDQSHTSLRAMMKGKELAQTDSKTVPEIALLNQMNRALYQPPEATGTKRGKRQESMEGLKLARGIHICTRTSRLRWEVDPAEKGITPMGMKTGNESVPVHGLLQPCAVVSPGVREPAVLVAASDHPLRWYKRYRSRSCIGSRERRTKCCHSWDHIERRV